MPDAWGSAERAVLDIKDNDDGTVTVSLNSDFQQAVTVTFPQWLWHNLIEHEAIRLGVLE